jgi:MFS family permease
MEKRNEGPRRGDVLTVIATDGEEAAESRIALTAWYGLAVLTAIHIFAQMDRIALAILLQPIKAELLLSDQQLGLLTGLAFALFYATLGIPLARLADRGSRTRLLAACLAMWTVMTALSGFARSFPQLFLARVGVGVGEAGCLPSSYSMIADMFPRSKRTLTVAIFQCGGTIGISLGTFTVGLLGYHLGWRACLQAIGLAGLPLALLVFLTLREPPRPKTSPSEAEPAGTVFRALSRRPAFVHLTLAYGISATCSYGIGQWNPTYLMRSFGLTMAEVGVWAGLGIAIGSVSGLLAGAGVATWLGKRDRRWEIWIPAIATLATIPCAISLALSSSVFMVLGCQIAMSVASSVAAGVAIAAVQGFVEPHRRATAVSVVIFANSILGLGLGPYLIGLASDLFTPAFGNESLRYGILASTVFLPWAAIHYMLAARRAAEDSVD